MINLRQLSSLLLLTSLAVSGMTNVPTSPGAVLTVDSSLDQTSVTDRTTSASRQPISLTEGEAKPDHHSSSGEKTLASGGPDHYGYTWSDTGIYAWIDAIHATGGITLPLVGDDDYVAKAIGFDFKFYENSYSQMYISTNGLITFKTGSTSYSNTAIPYPPKPNNLIAPFWYDLDLIRIPDPTYPYTGTVWYLQQADYAVIEWYGATIHGTDKRLTFEVILYNNGDICFQYAKMEDTIDHALYNASVGIEDPDGYDGLKYLYNEPGILSLVGNHSLCFTRPPTEARAKVLPPYQSSFLTNGQSSYQIAIHNIGDLYPPDPDTYDLIPTTVDGASWEVSFYDVSGANPLIDTNSTGIVDTGSIAQGSTITVTVKVQAPTSAISSEYTQFLVTARSSLNPSKTDAANFQCAIPPSFIQLYADSGIGMDLQVVGPTWRITRNLIGNYTGSEMNLALIPNGFYAAVWERHMGTYVNVEYSIFSSFGTILRRPSHLFDNGGISPPIRDRYPYVTTMQEGRIGVIWIRNEGESSIKSNVYLAILRSDGTLLQGPINVTGNPQVGNIEFKHPSLAGTQDGRFILTWEKDVLAPLTKDVYVAVYDGNGNQVKSPTVFAQGLSGQAEYLFPTTTDLTNSRTILAYSMRNPNTGVYTVTYSVLNSNGTKMVDPVQIQASAGYYADAVQLSTGKIVLAWKNALTYQINFVTITDGVNFPVDSGPTALPNPYNRRADNVSVTYDQEDHAILTWADGELRSFIYYALVTGDGEIITPAMIYLTGQTTDSDVYVSNAGGGNAPYTLGRVWLPLIFKRSR